MKVVREISLMQNISDYYKLTGKKVALVPTMGFLHPGHTSLILRAKAENDIVAVSIFVNPTQFGKGEDFDKYPRNFVRDYHICEKAGADYIFNPEVSEMYGKKNHTSIVVSEITERLEGKFRPGHFTGVATVVLKLLNAVKPARLYLGQKDAQQNVVIKGMIKDLNLDVDVILCETVRESNGLAMSSRNSYLTVEEKEKAAVLNLVLNEGKNMIVNQSASVIEIKKRIEEIIKEKAPEIELQYYEITDNELLEPIENPGEYKGEILISLAAKLGNTRLIDNIIFKK